MTHETRQLLPPALAEGYGKFRQFKYARQAQRYMRLAVESQKPHTMVIACCDSRAAPETIFDASAGELFVVRNVANIVPPYAPDGQRHSTSAALEFAVHSLGVKHIVVMGHGKCGGIQAVVSDMSPLSKGDFIGKWMADVKAVVDTVALPEGCSDHARHTIVERASVVQSLANLGQFPWVARLVEAGELTLIGAWFDIALGELYVVDADSSAWVKAGE
ncbi:MAG: carbonic anhydrase [Alphaproteobacteria bacterium]|nr:carbonic anhydrase [Alphaproteobacteria bacterium]